MEDKIDIRDGLPEVSFKDSDGIVKVGHFFGKTVFSNPDNGVVQTVILVITPTGEVVSRAPFQIRFVYNRMGYEPITPKTVIDNSHELSDDDDLIF